MLPDTFVNDDVVRIRIMKIQDCEAVSEIAKACFSDAWSQLMFEELFQYPTNFYLVAELEEKIVGFAGICISIDTADIMNIGVSEIHRGRGIGGKLLNRLLEQARAQGCEQMMLEVRSSNHSARALYQRYGFTEISLRKNYYGNPVEDGIVMSRKLKI